MFRTFTRRTSLLGSRLLSTATETSTRVEPQVAESLMQIGTRKVFDFEHDQCESLVYITVYVYS